MRRPKQQQNGTGDIALNLFKFNTIAMNYLVTGHSQNENDSAHSYIN